MKFFSRKQQDKLQQAQHVSDVFFDRRGKVLSLQRRKFFIEFHPEQLGSFWHTHRRPIFIIIGAFVGMSMIISSFQSHASVAIFYPNNCLGGWQNVNNATGAPQLSPDADPSEFSTANSAVVNNANAQMYCGGFAGDIPTDSSPKKFLVKFSWSVDNGSVVHQEPKPFETTTTTPATTDGSSAEVLPVDQNNSSDATDQNTQLQNQDQPAPSGDSVPSSSSGATDGASTGPQTFIQKYFFAPVFADDTTSTDVPPADILTTPDTTVDSSNTDSGIESVPIDTTTTSPEVVPTEISTDSSSTNPTDTVVTPPVDEGVPTTPAEDVSEPIVNVTYTLDGVTWNSLGTVTWANWKDVSFEIPPDVLSSWGDISKLQIGLSVVSSLDAVPTIYLDSMRVEVEYDETVAPPENPPTVKITTPDIQILSSGTDFNTGDSPSFDVTDPNLSVSEIYDLVQAGKAEVVDDPDGILNSNVVEETKKNLEPIKDALKSVIPDTGQVDTSLDTSQENSAPLDTNAPQIIEGDPPASVDIPPTQDTTTPSDSKSDSSARPLEVLPAPDDTSSFLWKTFPHIKDTLAMITKSVILQPEQKESLTKKTPKKIPEIHGHLLSLKPHVALADDTPPDPPTVDVRILDSAHNETGIPVEIVTVLINGVPHRRIVVNPPHEFHPGHYTMEVTLHSRNANLVSQQDFTWGVLTINIDRSIEMPGNDAYLQFGVLREDGHTVCNAKLDLDITRPSGSVDHLTTDDGTIQYDTQCGPDNVIEVPDYFAHYHVPNELGDYKMTFTATTANGPKTITDKFEVKNNNDIPFDVVRHGPTRIQPTAIYPVTIHITPRTDWSGTIREIVPASFAITPPNNSVPYEHIETVGDTKILSWNLSLQAGKETTIGYYFDAPDISPDFFLLGPLTFGDMSHPDFEEVREWQIASDGTDHWWVSGGTGVWSSSTNWSTTDGGASGTAAPTASDNCYFSNTPGAVTVTISSAATCLDLDFTKGTGFTGTLAGSSTLAISGKLSLASTQVTPTYTGTITFNATSGTQVITSNGKSLASSVTFNGSGGTWQLADNFNTTGTTLTLTAGTFDPNSKGVTLSGAGADSISGAFTFYDLTRTGTAVKTDSLSFTANQTITHSLTVTGNSATNRVLVQSNTFGTTRTLALSGASTTLTNADFTDITFTGSPTQSNSSAGDCGGNTGITTTAPTTRYWVAAGSASWSSTSSWSSSDGGGSGASVPLCHDTVTFHTGSGSGTRTITEDMPRLGADIDLTGIASGTVTLTNSVANTVYGSYKLATTTSPSGTNTTTLSGRASEQITNNGRTWTQAIVINAPSGTYQLQDAFTDSRSAAGALTLTNGTFDSNGFTVLLSGASSTFASSNSNTRTLTMGASIWQLSASTASTVAWNTATATNMTLNAGTSTIKYLDTGNNALTFSGGGLTFYNLYFLRSTSTGSITIVGNNTFNEFKDGGTAAHSLLFTAASTQTLNTWTVTGSSGNVITINSTTTATFALVKTGSGTVSSDWLNIQHSIASPSTLTWYAGANSTNNNSGGGCTATCGSGWIFTTPPTGTSCTATATGTWGGTETATFTGCSGAANANGARPGTGDNVKINSGVTVTLNANVAVTPNNIGIDGTLDTSATNYTFTTKNLSVNSGGTLTANGSTITLSGIDGILFNLNSSGTFTAGTSTVVMSGDGAFSNPNFLTKGTFTGSSGKFYNLTLNPAVSAARSYTFGAGAIEVGNNLDVKPTTGTFLLTVNLGATMTVTGSTTVERLNSSTATLTTTASNYAFTTNTLVLSAGGTFTPNASNITITGTSGTLLDNTSGTWTAQTGGTTTFNGAGTATLNAATLTFFNLAVTGSSGTKTLSGTVTLSGTGGTPLSISGGNTVDGGSGTLTFTGNSGSSPGTTIPSANITYNSITVNQSATTFKPDGTISAYAGGTLTVTAGTFDTTASNYNVSIGMVNIANSASATLKLNASTLSLTGTSATALFTKGASGVFTEGTSTVKAYCTSSCGTTMKFVSGTVTFYNITIDDAATIVNANGSITQDSGTTLYIKNGVFNNEGNTFTPGATSTLQIDSTGTFCIGGTTTATTATCDSGATQTGSLAMPAFTTFTLDAASTVIFLTDKDTTISNSPTYGNLTFKPKQTAARFYTFGGAMTINGNLDIFPGTGAFLLTVNAAGTITVASGKTTTIEKTSTATSKLCLQQTTCSSGSNYNLSTGFLNIATGGTLDAGSNSYNGTITLSGTGSTLFTLAGTFTILSGTPTVTITGGTSTINSGTITFYDLTVSGSGTDSVGASALTINHTLSVTSGIFNPNSTTITGSGTNTLTVSGTGTLQCDTSVFTTNYSSFETINFNSGSTVEYDKTNAQTILENASITGSGQYYNLKTSTGGVKSLNGTTTVSNLTSITGGSTISTVVGQGYALNTGSMSIDATSTLQARNSSTITFTGTSGTLFTLASGGSALWGTSTTAVFSGNGDATLTSGTITGSNAFTNVTLSPILTADHTYTWGSGAVEVAGNFDIVPSASSGFRLTVKLGASLTIGSTNTTTIERTSSAVSTLDTDSVGNYAFSTGRLIIQSGGTLAANGSNITIASTSVTAFTIGGTGVFTSGTSTVIFNGDGSITLTSGTFTGSNAFYNVTFSPTLTVNRTYTWGAGAIALNGNFDSNPSGAFTLINNLGSGGLTVTGSLTLEGTSSGVSSLDTVLNYALAAGTANIVTGSTLNIENSTFNLTGTSGTLLTRTGTFTAGSSSITLMNPNASVTLTSGAFTGSNAFNDLTLSPSMGSSSGKTYTFGSGAIAINGNFTINPDASAIRLFTVNMGSGGITVDPAKTTLIERQNSASALLDTQVAGYSLSTGKLNIDTGAQLTANASTITLTGTSSTLFTLAGNFVAGTSTVVISTNNTVTLTSGTFTSSNAFNNLTFSPTLSGSDKTYTFGSGAISVGGNFDSNPSGAFTLTTNLGSGGLTVTGSLTLEGTSSGVSTLDTTASNYALTAGTANIVTGSTLNIEGSTFTLNGTSGTLLTRTGTFTSTAASTTVMNPNASVTLTSGTFTGANNFGKLQLSPVLASTSKTYTFGSGAITVSGNFDIIPTASAGSLGLTVNMGADITVSSSRTLTIQPGASNSPTASLVPRPSGTTYNLNVGNVDIEANGTIDATGVTTSFFLVAGNWTNAGTFTAGSSTVTLATAATATVGGGPTTFYNLTINPSGSAKEVDFSTTGTHIIHVTNTFTVVGADNNYVSLFSTSSGTKWHFHPTGTAVVSYAKVRDGGCESGAITVNPTNSLSLGNNEFCWNIPNYITLVNSDDTVGFGALSPNAVTYANGAATGSATDVVAHTFTITSNAPSGYTLTYNGPTLTSGLNTINGTQTDLGTGGTPGTSQFAISGTMTTTNTGVMATHYDHSTPKWSFAPGTTTQIASGTGPITSDTIDMHYEANIIGTQAAGSYSTTLTYILTGNF